MLLWVAKLKFKRVGGGLNLLWAKVHGAYYAPLGSVNIG
jgi:hypothetical protein